MKLTRIGLEDFRCFGKADFDLRVPGGEKPLSLALFVGPNGTGKSSVVSAIAGLFGFIIHNTGADELTVDDVRSGKEVARIRAEWLDHVQDSCQEYDAEVLIHRHPSTTDGNQYPAGASFSLPSLVGELNHWVNAVLAPGRGEAGLIVSFDVYRLLQPISVAGPNAKAVVRHRTQGSMQPTVGRAGHLQPRFGQLKQWIVNLDFQRAKAKVDRNQDSPDWEILHAALDKMFSPYRFECVDEKFDVMFRTPTGLVPIEALSDGFRSIFVIVTEMLLRLSLTTDDPSRILLQEGVCIIDEIDAHLHPRWQKRILPSLRTLFPNVQFIATTHSPIIVSTAAPHEIFRFEEEAKE